VEHDQIIILELQLSELKSIMGRQQKSVRRNFLINATSDPLEQSWWESCTLGMAGRERFTVINKRSKEVSGSVSYWDMLPLSHATSGNTRGLYNLSIDENLRRTGIATYLVGESLKHLAKSNVTVVEAQTRSSDGASQALFEKLGFEKTSSGTLLSLALD
jgi:ribosomal protein S18 acetylase RimI-like enzyme